MQWSKSNNDLKIIFIAGNEEFTQGSYDYITSCKSAITKGIIINTIFCGNKDEGINTKWKHGADLADGKYLNIDQNKVVAYIESPFDTEITNLSNQLNSTYIAYGSFGSKNMERQEAQDNNAGAVSRTASVNRAVSKSSKVYNNSSWDLVDAVDDGSVKLSEIQDDELPPEMKKMTSKEREAYISKMKTDRKAIQDKINMLNKKRIAYVAKVNKSNAQENTLGTAMVNAVQQQAKEMNFTFKK